MITTEQLFRRFLQSLTFPWQVGAPGVCAITGWSGNVFTFHPNAKLPIPVLSELEPLLRHGLIRKWEKGRKGFEFITEDTKRRPSTGVILILPDDFATNFEIVDVMQDCAARTWHSLIELLILLHQNPIDGPHLIVNLDNNYSSVFTNLRLSYGDHVHVSGAAGDNKSGPVNLGKLRRFMEIGLPLQDVRRAARLEENIHVFVEHPKLADFVERDWPLTELEQISCGVMAKQQKEAA